MSSTKNTHDEAAATTATMINARVDSRRASTTTEDHNISPASRESEDDYISVSSSLDDHTLLLAENTRGDATRLYELCDSCEKLPDAMAAYVKLLNDFLDNRNWHRMSRRHQPNDLSRTDIQDITSRECRLLADILGVDERLEKFWKRLPSSSSRICSPKQKTQCFALEVRRTSSTALPDACFIQSISMTLTRGTSCTEFIGNDSGLFGKTLKIRRRENNHYLTKLVRGILLCGYKSRHICTSPSNTKSRCLISPAHCISFIISLGNRPSIEITKGVRTKSLEWTGGQPRKQVSSMVEKPASTKVKVKSDSGMCPSNWKLVPVAPCQFCNTSIIVFKCIEDRSCCEIQCWLIVLAFSRQRHTRLLNSSLLYLSQ
ncbi:hypothetical protein KCU83_g651, partial [Aureobasidium melanogenum]